MVLEKEKPRGRFYYIDQTQKIYLLEKYIDRDSFITQTKTRKYI